ncbi:MAG: 3-oxoacyl-ACP reductase FabG [Isosphaeraceae bacterium]
MKLETLTRSAIQLVENTRVSSQWDFWAFQSDASKDGTTEFVVKSFQESGRRQLAFVIDLSGRIALVTGSSQGIGAEIVRKLHRAGASVVINHPDCGPGLMKVRAEALAQELLAERKDSVLVIKADVSDAEDVMAMMESIRRQWSGLDILVNNAGILRDRTIPKMSLAEWNEVLAVNLTGVFISCKFGLEVMRDGGSIVNIGSLSARAGFIGQANYSSAKAGVKALTRVLSRECSRRMIRVNAVAPGMIETSMTAAIPEQFMTQMQASIPCKRLGKPEEVADAVLFLCSPMASYVTGHTLNVDGGWRG